MELYHASNQVVEFPEIRRSYYTKDFSWGFYCTNSMEQAKVWAIRRKNKVKLGNPTINIYEYQENKELNVLHFDEVNDEWLDFIASCRNGNLHRYDIVEGPMADDEIWEYVDDFLNGKMPREIFLAYAKFKKPTHQLSFHTIQGLSTLKFVKSEVINNA
ncbi:MAG: DUF3990 domain-containing protein [Turicibacter sp.]|nr:DUF3990 domain-containing protein [Turicibacter sp.]